MRIRLNLDDGTVQVLRRRAEAKNLSVPRFLAEMAQAEAKQEDYALAEEGYRLLAGDTQEFSENANGIASQDWE